MVGVLTATSFVAYADRQILAALLEPIKGELGLSDSEAGLLLGLFFALFTVLAGLPLGRFTDKYDRRLILSICVGVWSGATALCGLAQSFAQMAAARALVAAGEAGATPATSSLVGDLYPPDKRTSVFALVSAGGAAGLAAGLLGGSIVNAYYGWRAAFLAAAIPGVVLSLVLLFAVRDPPRLAHGQEEGRTWARLGAIIGSPTYRAAAALTICSTIVSYAALGWMPSFLARVYGFDGPRAGALLAAALVLGLILGLIFCGAISDRLAKRDVRWLAWIPAFGLAAGLPLGALVLFAPDALASIMAFGVFSFAMSFCVPPVMSIAAGIAGSASRGTVAATIPVLSSIGAAIGPLLVGLLSDRLEASAGASALRYAMGGVSLFLFAGVFSALAIGRSLRADYEAVRV